jgi:zinc transporter ZupT
MGLALGFVGGVLIYVSASHLLPEAREHEKFHSQTAFLLGVLLAVGLMFLE